MLSRSRSFALSFVALALALPACGGKSFNEGGGDPSGGTEAGGTEAGGTGSGGSSNHGGFATGGKAQGGSHAGGSSGNAGAGGSAHCEMFDDETGSTVTVQITNKAMYPLYLGQRTQGCGIGYLFSVADSTGKQLQEPGFCARSCENVRDGVFVGCPAIACAIGSAITLQPGESTLQQWSGVYTESATLPPECRSANIDGPSDPSGQCQLTKGVKPGAFTFTADAGTGIDCSQPPGGMCGDCMPNSNGGCTTFGAVVTGAVVTAVTKVMLDGSYGVGGPGGGGMVRPVEIVFQ